MKILTILFIICLPLILLSQQDSSEKDWKISGHFQLRTELDGRDFRSETPGILFASMRTRLSVSKSIFDELKFFVQIQDSRVLGEEPSTLSNIGNLDVHQAYLITQDPYDIPAQLKAGRFQVAYGTERFLGAVGWHFIGRSFDGTMLTIDPGFQLDLFALTLANRSGYIGNANPSLYQGIDNVQGFWMLGGWAQIPLNDNKLDLFTYFEDNTNKSNGEDNDLFRFTSGFSYWLNNDLLDAVIEAAYQYGSKTIATGDDIFENRDVGAYIISVNLIKKIGKYKFLLGADLLQGTEPGNDIYRTYDPTYGTNHKFYGLMDYFISIPDNTDGLGLNDYYARFSRKLGENYDINGTYHLMMSNVANTDNENIYGHEIDVLLGYKANKNTKITLGISTFLPDQLMYEKFREFGKPHADASFWSFLMITSAI